ncbi:hypothetical protein [Flavilitoribacter nigricans]|uniref:CBM-cenC domain-containing protein n=1 Tax=Flavilitoribacter nigricans (strain ATCC 23147 / DSM 23189 / NBRC 102662 / NCIMB 1420 / SS-2) TaxID=1122177 RepID=A0A2D0NEU5_FLAN2|nr:hypothetical protein [Flavilitoribacter nigricans]PHN07005.1 hypothetical protein CRP01_08580 [Flavilitoribacter nigricans DSM 23189 = NBRC 102662]
MQAKINLSFLLLFFASLLLVSCKKDDDDSMGSSSSELLTNGDLEIGSGTPNGWFTGPSCTDIDLSWTDEESFSPSKSVKISNTTLESDCFTYWGQHRNTDIPTGKSLTLRAMIKGQLEGNGVGIVIRGDDTPDISGTAEQFATTQGVSPISGTFDWTEYSLSLGPIEATTKSLTVYLVYHPGTTGDVYFDDVSLEFE